MMGDLSHDYPINPRNSSLYHYYSSTRVRQLQPISEHLDQAKENFDGIDKSVINDNLKRLIEIIESDRISESLNRFDGWHLAFRRSQNQRWIFIKSLFPISLAITSTVFLK